MTNQEHVGPDPAGAAFAGGRADSGRHADHQPELTATESTDAEPITTESIATESIATDSHAAEPTGGGSASARGRRRRRTGLRAVVTDIVVVLVGALVISTIVRQFVVQAFEIPSTSMTNTLLPNDRVVVSKLTDVHRGDVVVFRDPGGWLDDEHGSTRNGAGRALEALGLLPSTASDHLIKRLVGMPGDHVQCCDAQGRVMVNGQPLDEQDYLWVDPASGRRDAPARTPFNVVVPAGHVWVMGDHRSGSRDSRCHLQDVTTAGGPSGTNAFVPMDDVVGPAVAIVAPLHRLRRLQVPSTFGAVPPPASPAPADAVITSGGNCQG